jgi:hypothetical protein
VVRTVDDRASELCDPARLNPVTGPIHVEDAAPGDLPAVHFVAITPRRDWAVSTTCGAPAGPRARHGRRGAGRGAGVAPPGERRVPDVDGVGATAGRRVPDQQHDLVGWTGELLVLDPLGALQLVGQTGLAPVANMVAPNYTRVAKLPRWALGGTQAYDGLHGRLRQAAAEYLAQRT